MTVLKTFLELSGELCKEAWYLASKEEVLIDWFIDRMLSAPPFPPSILKSGFEAIKTLAFQREIAEKAYAHHRRMAKDCPFQSNGKATNCAARSYSFSETLQDAETLENIIETNPELNEIVRSMDVTGLPFCDLRFLLYRILIPNLRKFAEKKLASSSVQDCVEEVFKRAMGVKQDFTATAKDLGKKHEGKKFSLLPVFFLNSVLAALWRLLLKERRWQ
jgi:hypothetical protein